MACPDAKPLIGIPPKILSGGKDQRRLGPDRFGDGQCVFPLIDLGLIVAGCERAKVRTYASGQFWIIPAELANQRNHCREINATAQTAANLDIADQVFAHHLNEKLPQMIQPTFAVQEPFRLTGLSA